MEINISWFYPQDKCLCLERCDSPNFKGHNILSPQTITVSKSANVMLHYKCLKRAMPHESREMTFSVLNNHFFGPSAVTAYPNTTNTLEKTYENPEEFKGSPQK